MSRLRSKSKSVSVVQGMVNAAWPYVGGKRGLVVLAIGMAAAGMAMNWGWLVAVGIAPILLAVLPCAAMCALGLCMRMGGGKSCSSGDKISAERSDIEEGPNGTG